MGACLTRTALCSGFYCVLLGSRLKGDEFEGSNFLEKPTSFICLGVDRGVQLFYKTVVLLLLSKLDCTI